VREARAKSTQGKKKGQFVPCRVTNDPSCKGTLTVLLFLLYKIRITIFPAQGKVDDDSACFNNDDDGFLHRQFINAWRV